MPLRANVAVLVPSLDALARDPSTAIGLPPSALAALQAQIAAAQGAIAAAMSYAPTQTARAAVTDRTLDADQIAAELGQSRRWVFRNVKRLPFVRRISRKALAGSEAGLRRWRESQKD